MRKLPTCYQTKQHCICSERSACWYTGERVATRAAVDKVVSLAAKDVAILVVAGSILNKCEDIVGALKIFRHAQQLEPENDSVLFNLATSLRFLGELDEAEEVINRVIGSCPRRLPQIE